MIEIDKMEKRWLLSNHPAIAVTSRHTLEGIFHLKAVKIGDRKVARCDGIPDQDLLNNPRFVDDEFHIRASFGNLFPRVCEINNRFETLAKAKNEKTGKPLRDCRWDLHIFEDGSLCLGHKEVIAIVMQAHPGLQGFFEHLLMPYFYFHGYLEKYGVAPWPGLSHMLELATLEQIYYAQDDRDIVEACSQYAFQNSQLHRILKCPVNDLCQFICLCGSRPMRECHPAAFKGAMILRHKFGS